MKILCIGHSCYDIACIVDSFPLENSKNYLTEKIEGGGGSAANAATVLAKWGLETYLATAVGSDLYGEKIKKEFEMHGIKTNFVETNYDKTTSLSFILINKLNNSRTVYNINSFDSITKLKRGEITIEPDIILIDGYEYHTSLAVLNKFPNAISVIDASKINPETLDLSKLSKYIICSKDFAEKISGLNFDFNNSPTLLNIYNILKERFLHNELIITLEEKGALYVQNNQIKIMPGINIDAKDTTAAGDVFHGAFVYCLANKFDIEKSIAYANIAAGLSCAAIGEKLAIPNLSNVSSYYANKMSSQTNDSNINK